VQIWCENVRILDKNMQILAVWSTFFTQKPANLAKICWFLTRFGAKIAMFEILTI